MKKIISTSLLISTLVYGDLVKVIPLDKTFLSSENGGSQIAIDAYSDGVGIVTDSKLLVDNSPINLLVFKYGDSAKNNGMLLKDYVLDNSTNDEEINLANKIGASNFIDGTTCDDNNDETITDIYINGICLGNNVEGQSCNDGNEQTINDIYIPGVCLGTDIEGQSCDDNNIQTINDVYLSGICIGTNVEGQSCDDNNIQTINDIYNNGVCLGILSNGVSCNDNNDLTINDTYVNGVCTGTSIVGKSCNDNNAGTYNDVYNASGVCVGTTLVTTTTPASLAFSGYRSYTLAQGGRVSLVQAVSGSVNGSLTTLTVSTTPIYMEFKMNNNYLAVGIRPVSYKTRTGSLHFYNYPSTIISIYYNPNNKIASICKNGASCLRYTTTLNQLQVFLGSGTLSSGSIDYIRSTSHNSTYKNATINFSL